MIDPVRRRDTTSVRLDAPKGPEQKSEVQQSPKKEEPDLTALVASATASSLRPPEIRFDANSRLGGLIFETQAVASMEILKSSTQESSLNALATLIMRTSSDIMEHGTEDTKFGLATLDEMIRTTSILIASRIGKSG